jgi:hypothetical protein
VMDVTTVVGLVGAIAGVVILAWYHVELRTEVHSIRKETSRFPLFAVRDRLLGLVATGEMKESDRVWAFAYDAVTELLGMHQNLHLWSVLYRQVRLHGAVQRDRRLQQAIATCGREMAAAAVRAPALGDVLREADMAYRFMVLRRTTIWHWISLWTVLILLVVVIVLPWSGLRAAKRVFESVRNPTLSQIAALHERRATC